MSTKIGVIIVIVFSTLLVCYLSLNEFFKPAQPPSKPLDNLRVGNIGEFSIFDMFAQEKGYFKKNGLNVEIIHFASGPPSVNALLAGQIDIAVAADFVGVRNIFINNNLRILTQASRHKVWYMLSRKDKGIHDISDLKGKKIGVTRKGAGEFYLAQFLSFNHLSLKDVTLVDLSRDEMIQKFENGQLETIVIFDPYAYTIKNKFGDNAISWSVQGDRETFALVYATNSFIKSHPDVINRYLLSLIQAEQLFNSNPQFGQNFIAQSLHYDPQYIRYMWPSFKFTQTLDQELLLAMEDQARFVIHNNLTDTKKVPNYLDYIYFDGLEKIDPERISIIH